MEQLSELRDVRAMVIPNVILKTIIMLREYYMIFGFGSDIPFPNKCDLDILFLSYMSIYGEISNYRSRYLLCVHISWIT